MTCGLHPAQPREWVCPARAPHDESRVLDFSALSPLSACHLRAPIPSRITVRCEVVMLTETQYRARGDGNNFCETPISFQGKLAMAWHPLPVFSPSRSLRLRAGQPCVS